MNSLNIAVAFTDPEKTSFAETTAKRLNLTCIDATHSTTTSYDYLLTYTAHYVGLLKPNDKTWAPFYIDFVSKQMRYRMQRASLRKELIAKAMGSKPSQHPIIVDVTAGLGRDSLILATLGFNVILLERSPILAVLLQDALTRARSVPDVKPIIERLTFIEGDAIDWLKNTHPTPNVIYLDPMFPERQKSASVKKEMVILQELLGKDEDSDTLLTLALTCATGRVVVKRPRLASNLGAISPHFSLIGQSSRFDIYLK